MRLQEPLNKYVVLVHYRKGESALFLYSKIVQSCFTPTRVSMKRKSGFRFILNLRERVLYLFPHKK